IPGRSARHPPTSIVAVARDSGMNRSAALYLARLLFALAATASDCAGATDANIAAGATIYGNYCSNCPGDELRNTSGGVTFDLTRLRAANHDRFVNSVLNGKTQMPPWRGVLDMDRIDLVVHSGNGGSLTMHRLP